MTKIGDGDGFWSDAKTEIAPDSMLAIEHNKRIIENMDSSRNIIHEDVISSLEKHGITLFFGRPSDPDSSGKICFVYNSPLLALVIRNDDRSDPDRIRYAINTLESLGWEHTDTTEGELRTEKYPDGLKNYLLKFSTPIQQRGMSPNYVHVDELSYIETEG